MGLRSFRFILMCLFVSIASGAHAGTFWFPIDDTIHTARTSG